MINFQRTQQSEMLKGNFKIQQLSMIIGHNFIERVLRILSLCKSPNLLTFALQSNQELVN